jgi:TolB protein
MSRRAKTCVTTLAVLLLATPVGRAQTPEIDLPKITITNPNRDLLKVAIANGTGDAKRAADAAAFTRHNLTLVGLFQILDPKSFPPALHTEGLGFSSALWSQVGAQAVVKVEAVAEGAGTRLEGRLFQAGRGERAVLAKAYRGEDLRTLVHAFSNDVIGALTGTAGVFGSRIVFAQPKRELASVGMDGGQVAMHTLMRSDSLLPAFSPTGDRIAFTNYLRNNPDLWVVSARGGRAKRISDRQGMNTGAAWMPDGRRLAVTLSYQGNPDIYIISASDGKIEKRLTNNRAIDSSPAVSPDGSQIAFVTDRQGSPQIFLMPVAGGEGSARRLTFKGSYNQTPSWNPRKDRSLIAFTGRDERGTFDIFVLDLKTNQIQRMTQNQGSNFDPSWSPDGRLLVYASSRGGLFVLNPDTLSEIQVYRGAARAPDWGAPPAVAN